MTLSPPTADLGLVERALREALQKDPDRPVDISEAFYLPPGD
jgi:hypothetical protein